MTPNADLMRQKVLTFLKEFQRKHGYAASNRDIQDACGISSTYIVRFYLNGLKRQGKIDFDDSIARSIRVLECEGSIVIVHGGHMAICWTCRAVHLTETHEAAADWIENHKKKGTK